MGNFFSMENPLFQGLYKIAETVFVTILWIIFCIPLFTAGASTTALYYTVQKCLKNDRGTIWGCFWGSFKENFKTATGVSLIFLVVFFVGITDISILKYLENAGKSVHAGIIFFYVVLFIALVYCVWIFSSLARFDNKWKQLMKNALLMAIGHWPTTLAVAGILLFGIFIVWLVHVSIFIMPTICIWFMSLLLEKVFRRYMSPDDKKLDDELNMVYHNDYDKEKGQK